jgi:site-specific recombinase XerD
MTNVVRLHRDPTSFEAFAAFLGGREPKTVQTYLSTLRDFAAWLANKPGGAPFRPEIVTATAIGGYLNHLEELGRAPRTRAKALAALRRYCRWAQDEGHLRRNPAAQVTAPTVARMAPRELSPDQRFALRNLVERTADKRMGAFFALGYWAGLRISEVAGLKVSDVDVNQRAGALTIRDSKGGKTRTIDLANEARRALYDYLADEDLRDQASEWLFPSQRAAWLRSQGRPDGLTERGLTRLWNDLLATATKDEWDLVQDIHFHDCRHDFAHRARGAGWTLEEIAVYLGHQTRDGAPAITTTARYTLPSRQQIRERLQALRG